VTVVDQPEITVQAEIMDQGGGIGKVIWRLDGITIASESDAIRAVVVVPKTPTVPSVSVRRVAKMLTLLPGEHVIQVTAYDRHNRVASAGEPLKIMFKPKQQPVAPPLPALHVLAVGINRYRDKSLWLKYAVSDGEALTSTLRSTAAPLFQDVLVTHLTDDQATFAGLETAFRELPERIATRDVFVFHVAGHGVTMSGRYYFLPQDFRYHNADSIRATAINQESLQRWLSKIPAQKSLVLLDTCESGSFAYSLATIRGMAAKTAIDKLARATGRATIVASTENQPALEGYKGHGIFTYVLLRAFSRADTAFGNRDGYIGLLELAHHISARVPELSMEVFGFEQVPQVHILGSDFPLAVVPDK
jgi:hypothetical protein